MNQPSSQPTTENGTPPPKKVEGLQRFISLIRERLQVPDYAAAEELAVKGVRLLGPTYANRLYQPLWEHAMARGRSRLRAHFLREQSGWDPENGIAESLRQSMNAMAQQTPPLTDNLISDHDLLKLSESPALRDSWALWDECVRLLQRHLMNGPLGASEYDENSGDYSAGIHPIILTAGSGRSGSSAVFDWVNSFAEVEGTRGQYFYLRDFKATLKADFGSTRYRTYLVSMLWQTFLGRFIYTSKSSYRKAQLARKAMSSLGAAKVARACRNVMRQLVSAPLDSTDPLVRLPMLLECIAQMIGSPGHRFAATGWLDFDAADAYHYLTNANIVCSIRDPRDIYAEHLLLTRTFDRKVGKFIDDYRLKMKTLEDVTNAQCPPANVILVRFEDFVRSETTRRDLASRLGLDECNGRRTGGRFPFQPEKSAKNIGVFEQCEDKDAINQIRDALPEYCQLP